MSVDWLAVASPLTGVGGFVTGYLTLRFGRSDKAEKDSKAQIKQIAKDEQAPLEKAQADQAAQVAQLRDSIGRLESGQSGISVMVADLTSKMVAVETQGVFVLDMYKQITVNMAKNMAQIMHQPDPARRPLDDLLEGFMEGTLSRDEYISLKKFLIDIKNWIPGKDLGYPVQPWEPTAAGTFLSIIDFVEPSRMASAGHAMHRTHAGTSTTVTTTITQEEGQ